MFSFGSMLANAIPSFVSFAKNTALPAVKTWGKETALPALKDFGTDMAKDIATQAVSNMVMPSINTAQPYIQNIQQPQSQQRSYIQNNFNRRNYLG